MSKRRAVAGRHWLNAGKVKETVIGYLCSRGHYVFTAEGPEEDACQSKNVGAIVVRQVRSPGGWPEEQLDEFILEAEESLGRHLVTWRKCECDNERFNARRAEENAREWQLLAEAAEAKVARVEEAMRRPSHVPAGTVPMEWLRAALTGRERIEDQIDNEAANDSLAEDAPSIPWGQARASETRTTRTMMRRGMRDKNRQSRT